MRRTPSNVWSHVIGLTTSELINEKLRSEIKRGNPTFAFIKKCMFNLYDSGLMAGRVGKNEFLL